MKRVRLVLVVGSVGCLFLILSAFHPGAAVADPRPINPGITSNTIELLAYREADYRIKVIESNEMPPAGFERVDFPDTDFVSGFAPFGAGRGGAIGGGDCRLRASVRSEWPLLTRLLVRRHITIPRGVTNVRVMVSVDNDIIGGFLNGRPIANPTSHGECPIEDEFRFDVPQGLIREGQDNVVAFHLLDRPPTLGPANESFFDMRILAEAGDPELVGLEVNQSVQDWDNSVPLIEGKTTFVRAHIQTPTGGPSATFLFGHLRGFRDGAELPESPLAPVSASILPKTDAAARRGNWNDSLNFRLPEAWLRGTVELRVERLAPPGEPVGRLVCKEAAERAGDCAVTVSFTPGDELEIKLFYVLWENLVTGRPERPTYDQMVGLIRHTTAIFPTATLDFSFGELLLPSGTGHRQTRDELAKIYMQDVKSGVDVGNRLYHAVAPGDAPDGRGTAHIDLPVSTTEIVGVPQTVSTHELGHDLGREHAPFCGAEFTPIIDNAFPPNFVIMGDGPPKATLGPVDGGTNRQISGLDTSDPNQPVAFGPNQAFELMSYCEPAWISSYTYAAVRDEINRRFDPRSSPVVFSQSTATNAATQDFLLVRGTIDLRRSTADFYPFVRIESALPPDLPIPGDFAVQLRDAAGTVLAEIPFEAAGAHEDSDTASFLFPVLFDASAAHVLVLHRGIVIGRTSATPGIPAVRVIFPNGGESLRGNEVTLRWQASDPDSGPLTYFVQYSPDGGATWESIASGWREKSLEIERKFLTATRNGLIRVTASDGFNSATDESDTPFGALNNAPEVSIVAPNPNANFFGEEVIQFEALAHDPEDGILEPDRSQWMSSIDGFLDGGNNFARQASTLSEGRHIITVTATDSLGISDSSQRSIAVSRNARPQVKCNGRPATIVGTATGEFLTGTRGRDIIHGLGGRDVIVGLGGKDIICGGGGNDTLRGNQGDDKLFGGRGNDSLNGGRGNNLCNGGDGKNTALRCQR